MHSTHRKIKEAKKNVKKNIDEKETYKQKAGHKQRIREATQQQHKCFVVLHSTAAAAVIVVVVVVEISCTTKVCIINGYQRYRIEIRVFQRVHFTNNNSNNNNNTNTAAVAYDNAYMRPNYQRKFYESFHLLSSSFFAPVFHSAFAARIICLLHTGCHSPPQSVAFEAFAISGCNTWGMKGSFHCIFFVRSFACALCVLRVCLRALNATWFGWAWDNFMCLHQWIEIFCIQNATWSM